MVSCAGGRSIHGGDDTLVRRGRVTLWVSVVDRCVVEVS